MACLSTCTVYVDRSSKNLGEPWFLDVPTKPDRESSEHGDARPGSEASPHLLPTACWGSKIQ